MVKGRGLSLSDSRQGQVAAVADGIVTRDGLGGPGIESRWGRESPHPASYTMGTGRNTHVCLIQY